MQQKRNRAGYLNPAPRVGTRVNSLTEQKVHRTTFNTYHMLVQF